MAGPELIDPTVQILSKLTHLSMERHKVISNNLANVNTPNFKRQYLDYQKQLTSALKSGDEGELSKVSGAIVNDNDSPSRMDGNNVEATIEMNDLMQNTMYHRLLIKAMKSRMNIMKSAITGGR